MAELERAVRGSKRPAGFIARIHAESERLAANAAGRPEIEALVERLAALEHEARAALEERIRRKTACCEEAEELRESFDCPCRLPQTGADNQAVEFHVQ